MHCFNHPTYEAAGICRNCGRALCHDCIAICEEAVACKGKCEARVEAIQRMITTNQVMSGHLPTQLRQGGIYAAGSGLVFVAMGLMFAQMVGNDFGKYLGGSFIVLGILIIIRGIAALRAARKYPRAAVKPTTAQAFSADTFK
jgi:hypothetical protein